MKKQLEKDLIALLKELKASANKSKMQSEKETDGVLSGFHETRSLAYEESALRLQIILSNHFIIK